MLYNLDEICLIPAELSDVEHRGDVNVLTTKNKYPIFTAPMACVVDKTNVKKLDAHGLNVIVPRSVAWNDRIGFIKSGNWVAVGFKEAQLIYENLKIDSGKVRLCIDQADGHMTNLIELCKNLKTKFGDKIKIMTGNIANPSTYKKYAEAGIDYVRVGIGSGNVCTTTDQTGMHYPMGTLLIKLKNEKEKVKNAMKTSSASPYKSVPKVIADGGFNTIRQCVTALALGADFVMLGKILAKSEEACGTILQKATKRNKAIREYFGMSTEKAQILINDASIIKQDNFIPKHSEGLVASVLVEYHINDWLADFEHALRSSMSYSGARTLEQYIGKVLWDTRTPVPNKE